MSKKSKTVAHKATLNSNIYLGNCLLPEDLACFVAAIFARLDLISFYEHYGKKVEVLTTQKC